MNAEYVGTLRECKINGLKYRAKGNWRTLTRTDSPYDKVPGLMKAKLNKR